MTDSQRRPPSDPDYDQTTVHIPSSIWSEMTDFQHQYWAFKKVNFDTLIFAKLGKFYEMYCLDAEVGHRVLNLNFTHGGTDPNRPKQMLCVGVPQASLEGVVSKLVPLGYKVGIVEEMERSSDVKKVVGKKGSIVRRELRKVYTPGTLVSGEQLGGHEARPLLMIRPDDWDSRSMDQRTFGVCIVDCTTGQFTLGEASLLEVEVLLRAHRPHEILHEHGRLSPSIKTWLRHAAPLAVFSQQQRGELDGEMWRAETTLFRLGDYLGDLQEWPAALRNVSSGKPLALDAVGGVISYLKKLDLDRELVSLRAFAGLDDTSSTGGQAVMMLDAQTLTGLDVLESGDRLPIPGAEVTCLWHHLDRASTPFGRRLLRWWVTRPLVNAADIEGRLDAVDDLLGPASGILDLGHKLRKLPDLERKITRIHAHSLASQAQGVAEAATAQKKGVKELISCIDGFSEADRLRQHLTEAGSAAKSPLIRRLLARLPNLSAPLNDLSSRFDLQAARAAAAQKGDSQLSLHEGTDEAWDQAQGNMQAAEADLQEYIFAEKKRTGCVRMKFSGGSTSPYLLEVPADFPASRIPPEYMVLATTKSVKRYSNDLLLRLVDSLSEAQDQVDTAQREVVRTLCSVFHKHWAKWRLTVETLAEIDAVCALARASMGDDGLTMCRPEIHPAGEAGKPRLRVTGMRHPFLRCGGAFVPNDIQLGDGSGPESAALITGPNMGGKSTVLRLTCFAAIIAQLGCYVPAERMEISPVDQIFTRLGANDDLMRGRSTFLVELLDVSAMLSRATRDSLVIIDELGRGTSTFDGHAIAFGVFHDLIRLECRTLLSTHYHGLSQDFEHNAAVVPLHMDCRIDPVRPGELVMLYKLRKGVCPQSHGMECALSAGLPKSLVGRAREKAASFERSVATRGPKSKPPKSHDAGGAWDLRGDAAREREREMDVDEHETLSGPVVKPADAERFAAICLALGAIDALPTSNANTHLDCSQALAPYAALSALWVA